MIASLSRNIRSILLADAVTSAAAGVLMLAGGGLLAPLLGLPEPLLRLAGLGLVPFALMVAWAGLRGDVSRPAVGAVAAVNAAWVAASFLLLVSGWVAPALLGYAFVSVQALAVAIFATLQWMSLGRRPCAA
jgi:hypothetical protein